MGVAKLKKAELYYHKSVHEQIAAALQETGACQIISTTEENQSRPAEIEGQSTFRSIRGISLYIAHIQKGIAVSGLTGKDI